MSSNKQLELLAAIEKRARGFVPSSYESDLTMDGTAQTVAIATGAKKARIVNQGATTEAIRVAFGTSSADAGTNLGISTGAATTGVFIGAAADGYTPEIVLGIPDDATHIAIANATASDTQVVHLELGV